MNATSTPSHARAERGVAHAAAPRASTGVEGLDEILGGGLTRNRVYLLEGTPGTGKTTFALRFLLEGARRGRVGTGHLGAGVQRSRCVVHGTPQSRDDATSTPGRACAARQREDMGPSFL